MQWNHSVKDLQRLKGLISITKEYSTATCQWQVDIYAEIKKPHKVQNTPRHSISNIITSRHKAITQYQAINKTNGSQ
ncbi:MAG: hypothetical protein D3922_07030 [Candidatus Electrothrix sp. AR1]|nr:hypothetical protein [Candidatus Electrothrix sp. AR1]